MRAIPIVTQEDQKILSDMEIEIAGMMKEISSKEEGISKAEEKLADLYNDYAKYLAKYVRKLRDLSKQIEILSREGKSGVTQEDVQFIKNQITHIDEKIEKFEKLYDRLKDLSIQKKSLWEKRNDYAEVVVTAAKFRTKMVETKFKIEEAKNKMLPAEKVASSETKYKDLEREFQRSQKEKEKKWENYEKEMVEVNALWKKFKEAIDDKGME